MRANIQAFCLTLHAKDPSVSRGTQVLRQIAELSGGTVLAIESERDFTKAVAALRCNFSSWYRLDVEVPGTEKVGFYPFGIRPRDKSVTLRIPTSYLIEKQGTASISAAPESNPAVVK